MADYLILDLKDGAVKIKLRPDLAPNHVERVKTLPGWKHPYELMPGHPLSL